MIYNVLYIVYTLCTLYDICIHVCIYIYVLYRLRNTYIYTDIFDTYLERNMFDHTYTADIFQFIYIYTHMHEDFSHITNYICRYIYICILMSLFTQYIYVYINKYYNIMCLVFYIMYETIYIHI